MVSNADKEQHYLLEIYCSGKFPTQTIRMWKQVAVQDYAAATNYFEAEEAVLKEVQRLTGDRPAAHGFGSINVVIEENFDSLLEKTPALKKASTPRPKLS